MKELSFQQRELHRVQQQVKMKEQEMEYATMREEQLGRIENAQQKLAERQLSLSMKSEELNQMKIM